MALDQLRARAQSMLQSKQLRSISLYVIAIGLASGSNFASAPIVLALLGNEGFASWALIEPLLLIFIPVAGLGANVGILHLIAREGQDVRALGQILVPYLLSAALISSICGVLSFLQWGPSVSGLAALVVFVEGVLLLFGSFWRATDEPLKFALVEGGRAFAVVLTLIGFLVFSPTVIQTVGDYFVVRVCVGFVALALAIAVTRPALNFSGALTRSAVAFGLPIVTASMIIAVLSTVDRYVLALSGNGDKVTEYVAHVKLVQILGTAVTPFFAWFAPIAIRRIPEGETAHSFFAMTFYGFICVSMSLAAIMLSFTPLIWPLLFPSVAFDNTLFLILVLGMVLFSAGNPISLATLRPGKTWLAPVTTLINLAVCAAACFGLAQLDALLGVAMGRLLAYLSYTAALGWLTVRALNIRYAWAQILTVFAAFVASSSILTTAFDLTTVLGALVASIGILSVTLGCAWLLRPGK